MKLQKLNENIYISDQINTADIDTLNNLGIKTIINNRPDNEETKQPLSRDLSENAEKVGIKYYHLPVISGNYTSELNQKFSGLLITAKSPIVAFCRTGNRSIHLWAYSQAPSYGEDYVTAEANKLGFNI